MLKQIFSNKISAIALIILLSLYIITFFAPFFSPYHYGEEDILYSYAPPTKIHFCIFSQKIFRPYIYEQKFKINEYYKRDYSENIAKVYPVKLFVKGFKYKLLGFWEFDRHLFGVDGGKIFILGADLKGRDILSRIIYGGRVSLSIGLIAATISLFIGLIVGGISGYFGGKLDNFIMRICEMMMMVPVFYLMLALRSSFPPSLTSTQIYTLMIVILSFVGWAGMARVIRGMSYSLRENDFIYAAKASGLSNFKIIIRHILPHTFSYALVAIILSIPSYILGESALSLIGLGIQDPEASWGNLLSEAMGIVNIRLFPWILTPGIFILIAVICFNILGENLRDMLDPKRKIL